MNDRLIHCGVLGMKWGVRRYQNKDGSLTDKGLKRYAKKGYVQDVYDSNKTKAAKLYDRVTDAHKIAGSVQYEMSSSAENKARAEKYTNTTQRLKKSTQYRIGNLSAGEAIFQSMLMGGYGSLGKAVLNNWGNNITLGMLSENASW